MIGRVLTGALVLVLACPATTSFAQPTRPSQSAAISEIEAMNPVLTAAAGGADSAPLTAAAVRRLQLLASLMEGAPGEVLRLAVPAATREALPPQTRALSEEHVELTGTIEVSYEDHRTFSRLRHVLDTGAGRYSLHFAANLPDWLSGQQVRVRGVRVEQMLALDGAQTATMSAVDALQLASGEQRTLVVLVNFRDRATMPYTTAHAADVVFTQADGFFRENSNGAAWLTGDVYGWFTIAMDSTVCDTTTLANLARSAAQGAGATLANYSRFVYAFPPNACSWWGLGSVGGNPSQAWVNGELALEVAAHEVGHNLGLYHSRNMDCGAAPIGTSCTVNEYGDTLDMMGATRGHFNAFQKERLGWLAPSQIVTLTSAASGTYAVEPYSAGTPGVKALKILKSTDPTTGRRTFYYVEARQAVGYDSFMSSWTNVMTGVAVHTGSESGGNTSYLLDMTPETTSWYDPALVGGRTFTDAGAGLTLTTLTAGPAGASVSVALDPGTTCTPAAPTVALSPSARTGAAGTTFDYTVNVTNRSDAGCAASPFTFSASPPSGWSWSFSPASVTSLAPGASASTTLSLISPSDASGSYSFNVSSADGTSGLSASAAGSASVATSLTVTASATVSRTRTRSATIAVSVTSGSLPVPGAAVTVTVTTPTGGTTRLSGTTDSNGVASVQYSLKAKAPSGTYYSRAVASAGGATGSATISFIVP